MNRSFVWGAIVGIGAVYAFHKFVKPVAGKGQ
jgi:hypothetical protein